MLGPRAGAVDILDAQQEAPAGRCRQIMRPYRGQRMPQVQPPGRRRSEAADHRSHLTVNHRLCCHGRVTVAGDSVGTRFTAWEGPCFIPT